MSEWDEFPAAPTGGGGRAESSSRSGGGSEWDAFPPVGKSVGQQVSDVAIQVPTGFNEGLADIVGAPADVTRWLLNKIPGVDIKPEQFGSTTFKRGLGRIGADPDNEPATTPLQRVARGTGGGIVAAAVPEAVVGGFVRGGVLSATPRVAEALSSAFGSAETVPAVVGNAAVGAGGGAGAEGAAELTPEPYKPVARLAGGLAGGAAAAGAAAAGPAVRTMASGVRDYAAPLTEGGRERLAAETLRDRATSPAAAIDTLQNRSPDLIPGSEPTTFQATGDMGLGGLEREVATQNPADFNDRRATQNSARTAALQGIQDTGSSSDVANLFRSHLADLDAATDRTFNEAAERARTAGTGIGGTRPPEAYGAEIQGELQPGIDRATGAARDAVQGLGGAGQPETYGTTMRGSLGQARASAKRQERALWDAVDPDKSLALPATRLQRTADQLEGNLSSSAKPMTGEERAIFDIAKGYSDTVPFRDLTDLRSRVSTAMREELRSAGETPVYGRLTRLRQAIEGTISDAIEQTAEHDSAEVTAGRMPADAAMEARINAWAAEFRARQSDAVSRQTPGGVDAQRAAGAARVSGATREAGAGSRNSPGGEVAPGEALQPNFDAAAQERLRAASAATRERAQTFDRGTVGGVLRTQGQQGQYRTIDAAVPSAIFKPGPGGFEAMQAYRHAIGNDQAAVGALQDYAVSSLRRAAERPDGTIDPVRYGQWRRQHQDALRGLPGLTERFDQAVRASEAIDQVRPLSPEISAAHVPEHFFHPGVGGFEDVQQLRQLIGDDRAGFILSDYAASRLRQAAMRPDGTLDPAKFTTWRRQHQDALRAFPELDARFADAARATEAMADASAARKAALDSHQQGVVGRLIGVNDPQDVTRVIGGVFGQKDAVGTMRQLAQATASDPAARAGLRKAVVDHIAAKFISNTEAGTSGSGLIKADQFQSFIRQNEAALSEVFSLDEMRSLRAIGADLQRANRSITAVKLPGGSNTAQDTATRQMSLLRAILHHSVGAMTGAGAGSFAGPIGTVAGVIGGVAVSAMREAGIKRVDDLVKAAMLDPSLAARLLQKATINPDKGPAIRLAQYLRRAAALTLYEAPSRSDSGKRKNPVQLERPGDVHHGAENTAEPSPAQAEAGNYTKRHVVWKGLPLSIETEAGQERSGVSPDGKTWTVAMQHPYGYIKGTLGRDGDQVDVYVGPHPHSQHVFVFDQVDPRGGNFDEHKLVIGARDLTEAREIYDSGFSDGSGERRRGAVREMSVPELKQWLAKGDTRKPVALEAAAARPRAAQSTFSIRQPTLQELFADERPVAEIQADLQRAGFLA